MFHVLCWVDLSAGHLRVRVLYWWGLAGPNSIGRVQINSGGKKAGLVPVTGNTDKGQAGRLMVLGECTHRSEISEIPLVLCLSGQTQRRQQ